MFTLTGCTGDRFYLQVVEYLLDGLSAISSWHEFYIICAWGNYSLDELESTLACIRNQPSGRIRLIMMYSGSMYSEKQGPCTFCPGTKRWRICWVCFHGARKGISE